MTGVNQLGYLVIGVSDLTAWRGLASSVLGMELVPGDSHSTTYLRMDEHAHRIELRSDGVDDLEVIGWEVPDAAGAPRGRAASGRRGRPGEARHTR